ncbi:hypothetical protein P389DRAFT_194713 [Cystobasidium minutum MCA 4210]|uniref:uncharacterized protein n=1 Tax=Cystobasidium minutum MCA 4210 TaxID=1397322 RepID=UPI0034CECDCA|eukprot:jgi/Rhomi1/194713/gm1.2927_g
MRNSMESPAGTTLDPAEQPWSVRKAPLLKSVLDEGPDVIGFQEPRLEGQRDDIMNGLKTAYACTSQSISQGGEVSAVDSCRPIGTAGALAEVTHALVVRPTVAPDFLLNWKFFVQSIMLSVGRVELVKEEHFWLSQTPDVAYSRGWDAADVRMAIIGTFKLKNSKEVFRVVNTHFDWVGTKFKTEAVKLILERIRKSVSEKASTSSLDDSLVFLVGDFNSEASEPAYSLITTSSNSSFVDLRKGSQDENVPTWVEYSAAGKPYYPDMTIDYIFGAAAAVSTDASGKEVSMVPISETKCKVESVTVVDNEFELPAGEQQANSTAGEGGKFRYSDHRIFSPPLYTPLSSIPISSSSHPHLDGKQASKRASAAAATRIDTKQGLEQ